jgi:hypothetical protein
VAHGELKVIWAFNGIVIAFVPTKAKTEPFIVTQWRGLEVVLDVLASSVRYGQLPADKMVLVSAWLALRRDDILANWHA